jgi:hypothetical protein
VLSAEAPLSHLRQISLQGTALCHLFATVRALKSLRSLRELDFKYFQEQGDSAREMPLQLRDLIAAIDSMSVQTPLDESGALDDAASEHENEHEENVEQLEQIDGASDDEHDEANQHGEDDEDEDEDDENAPNEESDSFSFEFEFDDLVHDVDHEIDENSYDSLCLLFLTVHSVTPLTLHHCYRFAIICLLQLTRLDGVVITEVRATHARACAHSVSTELRRMNGTMRNQSSTKTSTKPQNETSLS